jgi:hypothetical protein
MKEQRIKKVFNYKENSEDPNITCKYCYHLMYEKGYKCYVIPNSPFKMEKLSGYCNKHNITLD